MLKYYIVIFLMLTNLAGFGSGTALAAGAPMLAVPPGLSLAQIKMTGSEFIMLQNNTGGSIPDLSKYSLFAFNNLNPVAAGVSSSSQQLPPASIAEGQTILLSANGGATCGAAVTAKLGLSLNDSGGFLEVVQSSFSNGVLTQTAGDSVSWSNGANPAAGMISNVPSNSSAPNTVYYRYQNTDNSPPHLWQLAETDPNNNCQLNVKIAGKPVAGPTNPGNALLPGTPPPAAIIEQDDAELNQSAIPASDIGLMAPQLNEVLPNPAEPQSDSEDEFIELYNSNDVAFDLSGFKLQVGTSTPRTYTFPVGTSLAPLSFTAFVSLDTGLSLANSGGQARFLDPLGNLINQTDVYATAKDGQAWALANGKWYWTTSPTPNSSNEIRQPLTIKNLSVSGEGTALAASTKKAPSSSSSAKVAAAPKAKTASSTSTKKSTASKDKPPAALTPQSNDLKDNKTNWPVLAGVGLLALSYACYEYRHDLANQLYRFRRYREARSALRQ